MFHLLHIEWLKVKNYRTFWVLFILYLISIVGANYFIYDRLHEELKDSLQKNPSDIFIKMMIGSPPYSFPLTWAMTSYVSSFLLLIPGFLTIILFTNEFSFKTHRQNLIDGLTRSQFIAAKMLGILSIAIISTLTISLTAFGFGFTGNNPVSGEFALYACLSFLQCLSYCLLALMLSTFFKRSGIALGVYFIYAVIFDNVLFWAFNKYVYNKGYFLPLESADNLIPLPIAKHIQSQRLDRPELSYILIACIIYLLLYITISFRKFRTDDL